MRLSPNHLILLSSAGYGVIFSLALSGLVRIGSGLAGAPVSPEVANNVFGIGCLILVPITTYFRFASRFYPAAPSQN